ncbi:hypothetical protein P7F88_03905 [Vibrio hannami]|uniref:hypothetical protein n=1 Tax=Vibrio hannami TaxID=2717094 RepID=UPI00240F59C4|nr:hypothetical protein [Vibrio hannami]MDG3085292.1 hypothetical protein [Vibrio hannami]
MLKKEKEAILERYLPGITRLPEEEADTRWRDASADITYKINSELQRLRGKGKDYLSVNELSRAERNICDYPDLLSYDVPHWRFQQYCIQSWENRDEAEEKRLTDAMEVPAFVRKAPEGYISEYKGEWIRLFVDKRFVYGNLYSAVHYIFDKVEEIVEQWIEQRYPYETQANSYLNQQEKPCPDTYRVEFTHNHPENHERAFAARAEFRKLYWKLLPELNAQLNRQAPATYRMDSTDYDGSPMTDFVCRNTSTLSLIRPKTFLDDFMALTRNPEELDFIANKYAKRVTNHLLSVGF